MAGIPLEELSPAARAAWTGLRDALRPVLGDDLVAMWAYGGTASADGPARKGDLDTHVILADLKPRRQAERRAWAPRSHGQAREPTTSAGSLAATCGATAAG